MIEISVVEQSATQIEGHGMGYPKTKATAISFQTPETTFWLLVISSLRNYARETNDTSF